MTIDEAREDVRRVENAIQKMLDELQARIGASIDGVSVTIIRSQMLGATSPVSYIGRVKIDVTL